MRFTLIGGNIYRNTMLFVVIVVPCQRLFPSQYIVLHSKTLYCWNVPVGIWFRRSFARSPRSSFCAACHHNRPSSWNIRWPRSLGSVRANTLLRAEYPATDFGNLCLRSRSVPVWENNDILWHAHKHISNDSLKVL